VTAVAARTWDVGPYQPGVEARAAQALAVADPAERLKAVQDSVEGVEALRRVMGERYAVATVLAHRDGYTYGQLATLLGVNAARVQQLMSKGRRLLAAQRDGH
jgi:DNA-directed RNA polymerase specialized sigma24 family protein